MPEPEDYQEYEAMLRQLRPRTPNLPSSLSPTRLHWSLLVAAAIAAAAVLILSVAVFRSSLHRMSPIQSAAKPDALTRTRQVVRTDAERTVLIPLADGSEIEVHPLSELTIEDSQDGMRLQLDHGSVIVEAAKQRVGHLYMRTRDVTVTVTGTIFFVGVEEKGSRVGVIEGQVRVQHGGDLKTLEPGEQLSTNPDMPAVSIAEEIAWSQNAPIHLALLGQSAAAQLPAKPSVPAPQESSVAAHAQQPSQMEFEVASVKRSEPGNLRGSTFEFLPGGGLRIVNGTLRAILETAYDVREYQILEGPGWVNSDRYDILARSATGAPAATDPPTNDIKLVRLRLQTLLAQRFKLKVRGETRQLPEYALEISKNGSKLVSDDTASARAGIQRSCGKMVATNTTMANLTVYLARQLERPVLDRTSLSGKYSFQLQWTPETGPCPGASDDSPSLFTALEEQLGLKLESINGPVDSLIIDHAEQPSEN